MSKANEFLFVGRGGGRGKVWSTHMSKGFVFDWEDGCFETYMYMYMYVHMHTQSHIKTSTLNMYYIKFCSQTYVPQYCSSVAGEEQQLITVSEKKKLYVYMYVAHCISDFKHQDT